MAAAKATGAGIRAYTLLSRTSKPLLKFLAELPKSHEDTVALFSLSLNADNLEPLVKSLQSLSVKHAGCLSAPFPSEPSKIACSIALFPRARAETVRTTMPGRKQAQVGRWRIDGRDEPAPLADTPPEMPADGKWAHVWDRHNPSRTQARFELGPLDDASTFIFFSDNAPEGLIEALDYQVPRKVAKLGMLSASTPFVTGRPYTLFHDSSIYSTGAVGVALRSDRPSQNDAHYHGYRPISDIMQITDARGNLVHKLSDQNPTQKLLETIELKQNTTRVLAEADFLTKEDEYFIGIPYSLEVDDKEPTYQRIYRITSGDPRKGTMSLDADDGPPIGTRVQFLKRSSTWPTALQTNTSDSSLLVQLQSTSDELSTSTDAGEPELVVMEKVFGTASEHGFISSALAGMPLGRGRCWRTSVLGAHATLAIS